jgi:hypothetical protein
MVICATNVGRIWKKLGRVSLPLTSCDQFCAHEFEIRVHHLFSVLSCSLLPVLVRRSL